MKLDRNVAGNKGRGKYALLLLRKLPDNRVDIAKAIELLESEGIIDWGDRQTPGEFFVIRLRDRFAGAALNAYAFNAISHGGEFAEFGEEVRELADRAGIGSPFEKLPD